MTALLIVAMFLTGFSLGYNGYMVLTNSWLRKLPVSWVVLSANLFVFIVLLTAVVSV